MLPGTLHPERDTIPQPQGRRPAGSLGWPQVWGLRLETHTGVLWPTGEREESPKALIPRRCGRRPTKALGRAPACWGEGEEGERQELLVSRPDKAPTHKLCSVCPGPTPAASGLEGATAGEQGPQPPS